MKGEEFRIKAGIDNRDLAGDEWVAFLQLALCVIRDGDDVGGHLKRPFSQKSQVELEPPVVKSWIEEGEVMDGDDAGAPHKER